MLVPPLFYGIYAIVKYQMKTKRNVPALIISGVAILGLMKVGLYSSNSEMSTYYKELYDKYKDEVVNPKYRGLKLYNNKKVY